MLVVKKRKKVYTKNNKKPKRNKRQRKPRSKKMKMKLNIIVSSLSLVLICVFLLSRYAHTTELQMKVVEKEKQIIELKEKRSALKLELEEIKDSGWIEEQAKARMNMRKANDEQIIYLDVK